MARKRVDTLELEAREMEWIRTHPRAVLDYFREHKRNRKLITQLLGQIEGLSKNLELAWEAHERVDAQRKELRRACGELYDILYGCACPIDNPEEWRRQVLQRASEAILKTELPP